MCASKKQIEANRKNAEKSTGPRTEQGKAAIAKNALKFGLRSKDIIVNSRYYSENADDYDDLIASLNLELRPQSPLQELLVTKIANCLWRYRRVIAAETARVTDQLRSIDHDLEFSIGNSDDETEQLREYFIGSRQIPRDDTYQLYEMRLEHQLLRSYRMLFRLQRQGQESLKKRLNKEREHLTTPSTDTNKPNSLDYTAPQ